MQDNEDMLNSSLEEGVLSDSCEAISISQVLGKVTGKQNQPRGPKKQDRKTFKKSEKNKNLDKNKGFKYK